MLYSSQMSAITLELPDDLAKRLRVHEARLPEILELGLRELNAERQSGFEGAAEVLEFLAGLPGDFPSATPQEFIIWRGINLLSIAGIARTAGDDRVCPCHLSIDGIHHSDELAFLSAAAFA